MMDPIEPWIDGNAVRRMAAQLISAPDRSEIDESSNAGFGPGFEGFTTVATELRMKSAGPLPIQESASLPVPKNEIPAAVVEPPARVEDRPKEVTPPQVRLRDSATSAEPAPESRESVDEIPRMPELPGQQPQQAPRLEIEAKPFLAEVGEEQRDKPKEEASNHPFQQVARPMRSEEGETRRGPLMERMFRFRDWLRRHAGARSVFVLDRDGQPVLDDPAYAKLHFLARSLSQAYRPVPGQPGNVHVKVGSDAYLVVIPVDTDFGCLVLGAVLPRPLDAPSVEIVAKALAEAAKPQGR
ncbi:hypothetical protein [Haloferula sp.]|uniref:hypothetical protein n=1 Tax=Haloferula sp. TaxID=2497595 RepID=UPI003C756623